MMLVFALPYPSMDTQTKPYPNPLRRSDRKREGVDRIRVTDAGKSYGCQSVSVSSIPHMLGGGRGHKGYWNTGCAQYSNPVRGYDGPTYPYLPRSPSGVELTYPYLPRSPSGVELTGSAEFGLEAGEFSQSHAALGVNESLRRAVVLSPNFPPYRSPSRWRRSPSASRRSGALRW